MLKVQLLRHTGYAGQATIDLTTVFNLVPDSDGGGYINASELVVAGGGLALAPGGSLYPGHWYFLEMEYVEVANK